VMSSIFIQYVWFSVTCCVRRKVVFEILLHQTECASSRFSRAFYWSITRTVRLPQKHCDTCRLSPVHSFQTVHVGLWVCLWNCKRITTVFGTMTTSGRRKECLLPFLITRVFFLKFYIVFLFSRRGLHYGTCSAATSPAAAWCEFLVLPPMTSEDKVYYRYTCKRLANMT